MKFGQRSDPFWVCKWPASSRVWSHLCTFLAVDQSSQPQYQLSHPSTSSNQTSSGCALCLSPPNVCLSPWIILPVWGLASFGWTLLHDPWGFSHYWSCLLTSVTRKLDYLQINSLFWFSPETHYQTVFNVIPMTALISQYDTMALLHFFGFHDLITQVSGSWLALDSEDEEVEKNLLWLDYCRFFCFMHTFCPKLHGQSSMWTDLDHVHVRSVMWMEMGVKG